MTASWRTTTAGILAIVVALCGAASALIDGDPLTNPDLSSLGAAIIAGIGLMKARDNKVSSEAAGVK